MSTVLDVAVCLLLVGAAVGTLAMAPTDDDGPERPDADRTAAEISTVTTSLPTNHHGTAHDTLAGHLATATVASATLSGDPLQETTYPASVRNETESTTPDRVYVTATWEAYQGSTLRGGIAAGSEPPADAETATRVLVVDSGIDPPTEPETCAELATQLAEAYVRWLFPPERTDARLRDDRTARETAVRYRSMARELETSVEEHVAEFDVGDANGALADELATRLASDLCGGHSTASAAAEDVTIDRVEIVVRRWEP